MAIPTSSLPSAVGTVTLLRILLVASLIIPTLLASAAALQDRRVLLAEAARRVDKTVEVLEQHATAAFHTYELVFARIDEHLRNTMESDDEIATHDYLARIDHELNEVGSLFVVNASGRVIAHSRFDPVPPSSVVDRDYYGALASTAPTTRRAIVGETGLAVGEPVSGRFSGTSKLNIARAIRSPTNDFLGLIAISVSQEYFEAFHGSLSSGSDSLILARADGAVLARSPALTEGQRAEADSVPRRQGLASRFTGQVQVFTSSIDGVERIAAYRKLQGYPIYVGYTVDTETVLQAWRWNAAAFGTVALLSAAALFGTTWLALRTLANEMSRREVVEAALRQSQKMEAIGQLTGGVAHDFNNLLAVVLGNLELLGKRMPDDQRLRRYLQGAVDGARRGVTLTQRMLAFSRRQDLKPDDVDVGSLIAGILDLIATSVGPTVEVKTCLPDGLPAVRVDGNQLEVALINLAVNARDAMPDGGQVLLSLSEAHAPGDDAPNVTAGRYVVVSATDTGTGMDEATLARAAEPFFTTKGVGKGTGLGLAMVHGLAAQSGGALRLTSRPGFGTTAELWLPVADGPPRFTTPVVAVAPPTIAGRLRVLVVDDDPLVLAKTVAFLEDLGQVPSEAGSGVAALAMMSEAVSPFDLVLTDQVMPGMTGTALRSELLTRHPGTPVLIMSGHMHPQGHRESDPPDLAKPFSQDELVVAIAAVTMTADATAQRGQ